MRDEMQRECEPQRRKQIRIRNSCRQNILLHRFQIIFGIYHMQENFLLLYLDSREFLRSNVEVFIFYSPSVKLLYDQWKRHKGIVLAVQHEHQSAKTWSWLSGWCSYGKIWHISPQNRKHSHATNLNQVVINEVNISGLQSFQHSFPSAFPSNPSCIIENPTQPPLREFISPLTLRHRQ